MFIEKKEFKNFSQKKLYLFFNLKKIGSTELTQIFLFMYGRILLFSVFSKKNYNQIIFWGAVWKPCHSLLILMKITKFLGFVDFDVDSNKECID